MERGCLPLELPYPEMMGSLSLVSGKKITHATCFALCVTSGPARRCGVLVDVKSLKTVKI
jgi:hypothetical protein